MGANTNHYVQPGHESLDREVLVQYHGPSGWEDCEYGRLCYLDAVHWATMLNEIQPDLPVRLFDITKGRAVCLFRGGISTPLQTVGIQYRDTIDQISELNIRPLDAIRAFAKSKGVALSEEIITDHYDFARVRTEEGDLVDAYLLGIPGRSMAAKSALEALEA